MPRNIIWLSFLPVPPHTIRSLIKNGACHFIPFIIHHTKIINDVKIDTFCHTFLWSSFISIFKEMAFSFSPFLLTLANAPREYQPSLGRRHELPMSPPKRVKRHYSRRVRYARHAL